MVSDPKAVFLGFIAQFVTPEQECLSGLLVTNTEGVPKEFRHTEPFKPSRLQSMLYGQTLDFSLGSQAMGPALLSELSIKPTLLCVDEEGQPFFGRFVVDARPGALLKVLPSAEHAFADFIAPDGNLLEAIELDARSQANGHLYAYLEDDTVGTGRRALDAAQQKMNLLTPFQRVRQVLVEVAKIAKSGGR